MGFSIGSFTRFVSNVGGAIGDVASGGADIIEDIGGGAVDLAGDVLGGAGDVVQDVVKQPINLTIGTLKDIADVPLAGVNNVFDVVEDVGGGFVDIVGGAVDDVWDAASDVVEDVAGGIVDVADDIWDTASDVVEDAWDNDVVRTAALIAGAYYGGTYFLESFAPSLVDSAFLAGYSPNAAGVLGYGLESLATSSFAQGVAKQLTGEVVAGAIGGGGGGATSRGFAPMRLPRGPSTQYGNFGARAAELGINADVADGMMKVANSDLEALQQFRRDVNRTATLGPTIELGSAQLGGIGVRSTTRGIS